MNNIADTLLNMSDKASQTDGNYIAMVVTLIVWGGLFYFIFGIDKRVKKLEEKSK